MFIKMQTIEKSLESKRALQRLFQKAFIEPRELNDHLYANRGDFFEKDLHSCNVFPSRYMTLFAKMGYEERIVNCPGGRLAIIMT